MTKNQDISNLVNSFLKHASFEAKVWKEYEITRKSLVSFGAEGIDYIIDAYQNTNDGTTSIYLSQVMGEIGDTKAVPCLKNWARYFSCYAFYTLMSEYSKIALITIGIRNGEFEKFIEEIKNKSFKELIKYFCPTSEESYIKAIIVKKLLLQRGEEVIPSIIEQLDLKHHATSESILVYMAKIANEICDEKLILSLDKIIDRKDMAAVIRRESALALTKMGGRRGFNELKRMVLSDSFPWDVRLRTMEEMYILGLGDIFEPNEKINFPKNSANDIFFVTFKSLFARLSKGEP